MKFRLLTYTAFITFLAIIVFAPPRVFAQGSNDMTNAERALARTDEIIETAKMVVQESRSQKGGLKLEKAIEIQKLAWNHFRERASLRAYNFTISARQEANEAIGIARLEARAMERVRRIVEETMDRAARTREILVESGLRAPGVVNLLNEVKDLVDKTQMQANQYRYELALKIAENARTRAVKAEQQARNMRSLKEMTQMRLQQLERLHERARERAGGSDNERTIRHLRLAEGQLEQTRVMLADSRYRAARITAEKCEKTLRTLIRNLPPNGAADPEVRLAEAYRLLERAGELVAGRTGEGDAQSAGMLERARRLIGNAEQAIEQNRIEEAKRLLTEARRLMRNALPSDREDTDPDEIEHLVGQVERVQEEISVMLETCEAEGVQTLYDRAVNHLAKAKAFLADGRGSNAAAEAGIARNMFNRIRDICTAR